MKHSKLLRQFIQFLKDPHQTSTFRVQQALPVLIAWSITASILSAILIGITLQIVNYSGKNALDDLSQEGTLYALFFACIVAPLLEETVFRLPQRISKRILFISLFLITQLASNIIINSIPNIQAYEINIRLSVFLLSPIILILLIQTNSIYQHALNFYSKHLKLIVYTLSIIFGLVHAFNYSELQQVYFVIPIITLPQLLLSFMLSFIRMSYGFRYSVLTHALYNAIFFAPSIFLIENSHYHYIGYILAVIILSIFVYGIQSLFRASFDLEK